MVRSPNREKIGDLGYEEALVKGSVTFEEIRKQLPATFLYSVY